MSDFPARIDALRSRFSAWEIDALLVTSPTNRLWLSGFAGSAGSLLITGSHAILSTDSRYWEQAALQAPDFELFQDGRRPADLESFIQRAGSARIGVEANHMTLADGETLFALKGPSWKLLADAVEPLRAIKDPGELEKMQAAASITDSAMAQVPALVQTGISESELAWALEKHMREAGAEKLAFETIVAFGPHSARPHHRPGDRRLSPNEIVLVDMGAARYGYCSDMTRTFFFGTPDERFQTIFGAVLAAEQAAIEQLRPGYDSQAGHALAADVIAATGYGEYFGHGLGHGVGLDIHEAPFLSPTRTAVTLERGMTITIEPGIYLPGWGGVRIEDLGVLEHDGLRCISTSPKIPVIPLS